MGAIAGFVLSRRADVRVLLVLPFLSSSLGLFWLDHAKTIRNIGRYIKKYVEAPVGELLGAGIMRWESIAHGHARQLSDRLTFLGPLALVFMSPSWLSLAVTVSKLDTGGLVCAWILGVVLTVIVLVIWVRYLVDQDDKPTE